MGAERLSPMTPLLVLKGTSVGPGLYRGGAARAGATRQSALRPHKSGPMDPPPQVVRTFWSRRKAPMVSVMNMITPSTAPDKRSHDPQAEDDIPPAFGRAFQPTSLERTARLLQVVQHALIGWFDRQREMPWMPRATDPVAELKHVWLGEYGVVPVAFEHRSSRRRSYE